jgi:hypothetical protein
MKARKKEKEKKKREVKMEWSYTGSNREDLDWNPQSNRRRRQPRCAWWGMVEKEALQHGKT